MKILGLLVILFLSLCSPQFRLVIEESYGGEAHLYCVSDLQGDGYKELIISDRATGQVMCYDFSGSILWALELHYPVISAATHDIDHDGRKELFLLEEVTPSEFHTYRISSVDAEGAVSWRKYIEVAIPMSPEFHFLEVDGEEGDEILIANRIIQGRGFDRFEFGRDRMIIGATKNGTTPYFLIYDPEDAVYGLYTLDVEPLWEGIPCQREGGAPGVFDPMNEMCAQAGIDCCCEKYRYQEGTPLLKAIPYVLDFTGDGAEEQICFAHMQVQVSTPPGGILWTWDSPESIEHLFLEDLTGDGCLEIIVETTPRWLHGTDLYVLNMRGEYITTVRLTDSGNASVHFSDLDGDGDTDLVTFTTSKKSRLNIYSNTCRDGSLDALPSAGYTHGLDPLHPTPPQCALYAVFIGGILLLVIALKRKRRHDQG